MTDYVNSPAFKNLSPAAQMTFKTIWEERQSIFVEGFKRETDTRVYFEGGDHVPKTKLIDQLVPDYMGLGNFVRLSIPDRTSLKLVFNMTQLESWRKCSSKEKTSLKKSLVASAKSLHFNPFRWEVYQNISDVEDMFSVYTPVDGVSYPVRDIDPKSVLQARERLLKSQDISEKYYPELAKLLYKPWHPPGADPYHTIVKHNEEHQQRVKLLNTFEKAPWQSEGGLLSPEIATLPGPFKAFFDHLFDDEVSKQSVFAWLRRMIFGENGKANEVALVLNGAKGIGKNIFADICKGLVGTTNFTIAKRSILTSDFNLDLRDCLCFFLDEIPLNTADKCSKFRAYMNEDLSLEGKGMESRSYTTYKSFILNNNPPDEVRVAWDDRRFTVPDLTNLMLKKVWPVSKIASFLKYIENFSGLHYRHLASWLFHHSDTETYSLTYCHKGERFSEMVLASLTIWQSTLRTELLKAKENELFLRDGIEIDTIKNACSAKDSWPIETSTIKAFLESYIERDSRLGVLKRERVTDLHDSSKTSEVVKVYPPDEGQMIIDMML